jgi:hypothetical protein
MTTQDDSFGWILGDPPMFGPTAPTIQEEGVTEPGDVVDPLADLEETRPPDSYDLSPRQLGVPHRSQWHPSTPVAWGGIFRLSKSTVIFRNASLFDIFFSGPRRR